MSHKQVEKFIDAARKLDVDDDERRFDAILKRVAKSPPPKPERGAKKTGKDVSGAE